MTARARLQQLARDAMGERGFEPEFPPAAQAQASSASSREAAASGTRDLRTLLWCSIDNDDSRDLDQLSVAEPRDAGTGILIAIADVDALVPRGSPIDAHAAINTTSVYTAARVFPMLPERLSTDLTSLNPDADRRAVIIDFTVSTNGAVHDSALYLALVRNHAKLAYPSVGAWLTGDAEAPSALTAVPGLAENLRLQDTAAQALKSSRHERGALTLDTVEGKPIFAGEELQDLAAVHRSRASELIEDFMIAANTATAEFLEQHGFASLRRIVRMPERWPRIVTLAARTGTTLPPAPDARALERWLCAQQQRDPQRFVDLSLAIVKLLGRGEYVVEQPHEPTPDHFGLAGPHQAGACDSLRHHHQHRRVPAVPDTGDRLPDRCAPKPRSATRRYRLSAPARQTVLRAPFSRKRKAPRQVSKSRGAFASSECLAVLPSS